MKIPSDNRWTQLNNGDLLGVLHETHNITLDENGKIRLSRKAANIFDSNSGTNLNYIMSIVYYNSTYFILSTADAYLRDPKSGFATQVSLSTDVGLNSDAVVCYGNVQISTNDNIDYYNGSLNTNNYALTADVPHPMTVFESLPTYKLCVGNDNTVVPLSSAYAAGTILTLPTEYLVTTLAYRNGYLYVGTKHTNNGEAKVFIWDGASANANYEVPTGASWVYSIIPYMSSVACITNQGQLIGIEGNTPVQLGQLPVFSHPDAIWDDGSNIAYLGKVTHRGMVAVGNTIYLNINGYVDQGHVPGMKHGLWVYDTDVGLYHRTSHTLDLNKKATTPSGLSSSALTITSHGMKTGDVVVFGNIGSLTGVQADTKYYVSVVNANSFKLAISRKALQNGNTVTIGGSVGAATMMYSPNTDWDGGYGSSQFQGAIAKVNPEEPVFPGTESQVIWGARIDEFDGSALYAVYSFIDSWNIGRFTTQRIYTDNLSQVWQKIAGFIDGCHLDNEKIIIKYKTGDSFGYPTEVFQGIWASATEINSVASTQDEDQWTDLEVGDELTIVDGRGRGYTTHITAISGTYKVTVDESIGVLNDTVYFYADKFHKVQEITNSRVLKDFFTVTLPAVKSAWIMLKFELRGFEIEVSLLDLIHQVDKSAT